MRKYLSILICCILFLMSTEAVYADEEPNADEWYEMVEEDFILSADEENAQIMPYTLYLAGVNTYIKKLSSSKIGMYVEVQCAQSVSSISTTFYLQKNYSGTWKNVSSGTVSASNASYMSKSVSVSGVTSGTYRAKTVTRVTDRYGYSESVTGYSGSMSI